MIFKKQIKGCCEYWVKWQFRVKNYAIGKYNPGSSGSWFLEIDDMHYPIRKTYFGGVMSCKHGYTSVKFIGTIGL